MFICVGSSEDFSFAKSVGVGLVDSAIGLSVICLQHAPSHIVFVASAGSYDSSVNIGDVFYSFCATQIEMSFLQNLSYTPIDNAISSEDSIAIKNSNKDSAKDSSVSHETFPRSIFGVSRSFEVPHVVVNSSNYITNTSEFNSRMLHAGVRLENMEFFSVLSVARHFNVPCVGIFCVSNHVGKDAHNEFRANHVRVKKILSEFVYSHFRADFGVDSIQDSINNSKMQ